LTITRAEFRSLLSAGPILADGATGTMLHARGVGREACFDELNLTRPDLVLDLHRAYLASGARLIETNSFGANPYKLATHGLDGRVAEINARAAQLAAQAVREGGAQAWVGGSVGPLGVRLTPYGRVTAEQAEAAFRSQIEALRSGGADLIIIETHSDVAEVSAALRAARSVGDFPVITSLTFTRDDRTLLGDTPAAAAAALAAAGADVIGANCSGGPAQLLRILLQMKEAAPGVPLSVMPNAGWPERVAERILYPATPAYFAEHALAFREAGAGIIGGCCGTTPEHIAAMAEALAQPGRSTRIEIPTVPGPAAAEGPPATEPPTRLAARLADRHFIVSVEIDPPRGLSMHKLQAGASLLTEAGADVINIADSPMARMRMSPWAICHRLQHDQGIETVLHFPTRGRNLLRIQGDLLAAHALGVRNLFVVMGDPTAIGDYPDALDDYDVVPSGLIRLIKQGFNVGLDHAGGELGEATSFIAGCALNLAAPDPRRELRALRKKISAGADFALTQPVYDARLVRSFIADYQAAYGRPEIPILLGMLPLLNERHATYLDNEVPGIQIPEAVLRRMQAAGSQGQQEGLRICHELLRELADVVRGVYLIPSFGRFDLAAELIEAIRKEEWGDGDQ
jgi:homocysteine S-methyltransferase